MRPSVRFWLRSWLRCPEAVRGERQPGRYDVLPRGRCANGLGLGLTGVVSNQKADRPAYWGHAFDSTGDNLFIGNDYRIPVADGGLAAKRYAWKGSYMHTWSTWIGADAQDAGGTAVAIP